MEDGGKMPPCSVRLSDHSMTSNDDIFNEERISASLNRQSRSSPAWDILIFNLILPEIGTSGSSDFRISEYKNNGNQQTRKEVP
jgi:hypothetical protein